MLALNIIDADVFLQSHEDLTCGFWDYYANEDGGGWSTEGCTLSFENDRVVCKCDHLTNFAVLIVSFRNSSVVCLYRRVGLGPALCIFNSPTCSSLFEFS